MESADRATPATKGLAVGARLPGDVPSNVAALLKYLEVAAIDESGAGTPPWASVLERTVRELADGYPEFDWTGIYLEESGELLLGPFVGEPTEHRRIPVGEGICGAAAAEARTIIVDDVNSDPRYLACFASTKSEIVVPIFRDADPAGVVIGEIDVDSDQPAAFSDSHRQVLERIAGALGRLAPETYIQAAAGVAAVAQSEN